MRAARPLDSCVRGNDGLSGKVGTGAIFSARSLGTPPDYSVDSIPVSGPTLATGTGPRVTTPS